MTISPRLRFAAGRIALWRDTDRVQLGLDPRTAVVVDGLTPGLAELTRGVNGRNRAEDLVRLATAAGTEPDAAAAFLAELRARGLVEPAEEADRVPDWFSADAAAWQLRAGHGGNEQWARRAAATVLVQGDGRTAVALARLLATAAVGCVVVRAPGRVTAADVGTGYRV
ncbi:MAG TPA: hypothetical protein VGD67_16760, partial [Pseudonocardiaceae bacterium]